ncbi:MAG TPA: translocation/assembly module TamB [Dissulfurispiraceae bacterium]|nr:translocation/assembly module TamB [Dissulfurispiraceae bacterium]
MLIQNKKKLIYYAIITVFVALIFYVLRGPNISNELKKLILPELENATGKKFVAQKIYINLIPLFIEIKELKAFDEAGNKVLTAERVKGYLNLGGFFDKQIVVKRLVIRGAKLYTDDEQVESTVRHIVNFLQQESRFPFKLVIKSISLNDTEITHRSGDGEFAAQSLQADILLGKTPRFKIDAGNVSARLAQTPSFRAAVETDFTLQGNVIDMKKLRIRSGATDLNVGGNLDTEGRKGSFLADLRLAFETLKQTFSLKSPGQGQIDAKGSVELREGKSLLDRLFVHLNVKGEFYIESLMELLKVDEKLLGLVQGEGKVEGTLSGLHGTAKAVLTKGNLFDVESETLSCDITYENGLMRFSNGAARLYGGTATAEATITLPKVLAFTLSVKADNIDSTGVFKLIHWDPGIAPGKVSGELRTSGSAFQPEGNFIYRSVQSGPDILGRVQSVSGPFSMRGQTLSLPDLHIATADSRATGRGEVDLGNKRLAFAGSGDSGNTLDFFSPYFTSFSGPVSYEIQLGGPLADPALSVRFSGHDDVFVTSGPEIPDFLQKTTLKIGSISGSIHYRKNLMTIHDLVTRTGTETIQVKGTVGFRDAKHLFDIRDPAYALSVSGTSLAVRNVAEAFREVPAFGGVMNTGFNVSGTKKNLRLAGNMNAGNFSWEPYFVAAAANAAFVYENNRFMLEPFVLRNGQSVVQGKGSIAFEGSYTISAKGTQVNLIDMLPSGPRTELRRKNIKTFMLSQLELNGAATFKRPVLSVAGSLFSTAEKGQSLGKGTFAGILRDRNFAVSAKLVDNRAVLNGDVLLDAPFPWRATLDLNSARADFLLTSFFPKAPDDLIINLKGRLVASGTNNEIDARLNLDKALIYAYGTSLSNAAPLNLLLKNRHFTMTPVKFRGDTAEVDISGSADLGSRIDLHAEGSSSLTLLKLIIPQFDVSRGTGYFVMSVNGPWESPRFDGALDVSNGAFALAGIPYRLTEVAAYVVFDENRFILQQATGRVAGGVVTATGTASTRGFALERYFLDARVKGITVSSPQKILANLDGALVYQGTPDKQQITGDVQIRRASYTERFDLLSMLLKSKSREVPNRELTPLERATLNVRISGNNLIIDNNLARATLAVDATLRGTVAAPVLLGRIEALQGTAFFRNNEFRIQSAKLDFADPSRNRPYISLMATSRVSTYQVRLNLDGYIDQFSLAVASDPPLAESEIFSLLAFGQTGQTGKEVSGSLGVGGATSFLAGRIQNTLEERIRTVTGIDRIVVEPAVSRSTGSVAPRVSAQKRLLDDKLLVTYSAAAGTGEEQIWKVEYFIGKNTSLVGQRDEKGGIGGDVKLRFEFR